MKDNNSPSHIHRYELVERIAVGGMAEVFRAKTFGVQGFEKQLAVKRILPELASNREFVDRFIGEAKIAATLNHANIVQVLDFSRFGDSLFIAMEFIDGCDLSALFKWYRQEGKVLPIAAALHISIEILKGLNFAHGREVVHRDMSPANILVSKSGEVKIADFGIARAAGGGSGYTNPFQILGKWRYMSPEQTRAEPLTAASDLFSTAIMVHEAFTGKRLFDQEEPAEIANAVRDRPIPRIRDFRPELSASLDEIVLRGLNRDPEKRGTAESMMRALIELSYAQSLPVTAMDLAEIVKNFAGGPGDSNLTSPSDTGQLIDDIINSELQHRRPGCQTRLTRITPAGAPPSDGNFEDAVTGLTFVDGGQGPDGLTQWLVGSAVGGPVDISSDFDFNLATVSGATGTSEVTPTQIFELSKVPPLPEPALSQGQLEGVIHSAGNTPHADPLRPSENARWPIWVAAAVASLVAAMAFFFATDSSKAEPESVALVATTEAATEPEPESVPEPESESESEPEPEPEPQAAREPVPQPEVQLVIRSKPAGAVVQLDGKKLGTTPLKVSVQRADQSLTLRLRLDGYRTHSRSLDLSAPGPIRIRETLRKKATEPDSVTVTSTIDVFVKPWANVYFRGKKIAEAPAKGIRLPHGTHRLRLENPVTGQKKTVTVVVPSNKSYRFTL